MHDPSPIACAQCGSTRDVATVSPDLDISPVALCLLCRAVLAGLLTDPRKRGARRG